MDGNPTLMVLAEALRACDRDAAKRFSAALADPGSPRVIANGVSSPIIRLPWRQTSGFFEELFALSNERFFRGRLPACRISWNTRFRNLAGRITCRDRLIELSAPHFEACGPVALGIVLVHEQIHLSLWSQRRPYGHTAEFKWYSRELGLPLIHHQLPLPDRLARPRPVHVYRCRCGQEIESRVRFRSPRACAACCARHAGGRFDARFMLRHVGVKTDHAGVA